MIILAAWTAELLDVKGAFLNGRFQNGKILYMHVPLGFESNAVLERAVEGILLYGVQKEQGRSMPY
eukprot:1382722-Ditylum_brightwellii.AAC.1